MSSTPKSLKIKAQDHHDLKIISACVQDAIFPSTAMEYNSHENRFSIIANRFMWEEETVYYEDSCLFKRVHAGLHFCHVNSVKYKLMDLKDPTKIHNLLTLHSDDKEINLLFSDKGIIRLKVEKIHCHLHDLHEPWYTPLMPYHEARTSY